MIHDSLNEKAFYKLYGKMKGTVIEIDSQGYEKILNGYANNAL